MSPVNAFAKAVGGKVAHITAVSNMASIEKHGLRSAADSARFADISVRSLELRTTRRQIGEATLNHQLPIVHGLNAARRVLQGHTPESWAAQLDERVFFWPKNKGVEFAKSMSKALSSDVIWLDAAAFADRYLDHIDLCAINSGNFRQGGANVLRGNWIYRPLAEGLDSFRAYRSLKGLKTGSDNVKEISLRCAISAEHLAELKI